MSVYLLQRVNTCLSPCVSAYLANKADSGSDLCTLCFNMQKTVQTSSRAQLTQMSAESLDIGGGIYYKNTLFKYTYFCNLHVIFALESTVASTTPASSTYFLLPFTCFYFYYFTL